MPSLYWGRFLVTEQQIILRINAALIDEFEIDSALLQPEASLYEDLGLDSLDSVDMVVVLEQSFKVKIRETDGIQNIRTLADLHAFVLGKVGMS